MALPDIDMYEIRQHRGNQADAFEELVCQLANDETVNDRLRFDRKGRGGDAGVECFVTLADKSEIGWQVKFYTNFDSMISSLDKITELLSIMTSSGETRFKGLTG